MNTPTTVFVTLVLSLICASEEVNNRFILTENADYYVDQDDGGDLAYEGDKNDTENVDFLYNDTDDNKNDTITFFRHFDNEFYTNIVIGQPGKTMQIVFDTMISYSWLISERCDILQENGCRFHNRYDHRKSSYYKRGNKEFSDEKTELSGFYAYENITIGAHSKLKAYSFIEMTKVPSSFAANKADGIFGLGPKASFFHNLYETKQISKPIFSVYMNRDRQSDRGGSIMLGYYSDRLIHKTKVNKTIIPDPIKYVTIDDGDYWKFSMDKITVVPKPGNNVTLCTAGCKAITNIVSGKIVGPETEVMELNYQINAKLLTDNTWVVNCDTVNLLPRIDFVIGGQTFSLEGRNYILKFTTDYATICVSAFTPSTDSTLKNTWVLGGAFLSQFYSIYDIEKKTIGLVRTPN